ncbi:hypothetical protein EV179_002808 [Coemansia sp. RSA 487]|nr:hypothetical protein LPJ74_002228 [Coemansia sp. RSA 1843]KAJ2089600.1 hypothetical protein IW138_003342 [Coemansia sp. RSA 986]KAJ2214703.1 hypothetical protein EV179_002808 [Coemansia sp. RSA 487]
MLYLWFIGNMLYGAYAVADKLYVGLIIQPQLFALFTMINILQVYWYCYKWSISVIALSCVLLCIFYAGLHIGIWKGIEHAIDEKQDSAVTFLGILPAIFIAVGFFPEFYVCIKEKYVEMSSFFILLDTLGGVFSTISLAFDHTFDYVASITYLIVVLLDLILALMKFYFYIRRKQGKSRSELTDRSEENSNQRNSFTANGKANSNAQESSHSSHDSNLERGL